MTTRIYVFQMITSVRLDFCSRVLADAENRSYVYPCIEYCIIILLVAELCVGV